MAQAFTLPFPSALAPPWGGFFPLSRAPARPAASRAPARTLTLSSIPSLTRASLSIILERRVVRLSREKDS